MLERFDRELRRASRAWQDAYGQAERDGDQLILTVPDGFVRELRKFPLPAVTERRHLEICDARVDPLTLLTEPVGETFAVLALWPLTALVFALASFGCDIEVCRWPPKESDRVMNGNPAERRGHYERLLQGAGSLADSREQEAFKISVAEIESLPVRGPAPG